MTAGPFVWALLAAALFGASTPASKALLDELGPFTLAGLLYLGAALAVVPRAGGVPRGALRDGRTLRRLGGAVLFGGVVGPVLLLAGLAIASASAVSIWLSLETVFTALLARVFFREHVGPRTALAIALIVASSALLASPSLEALTPAALLVAGACLAWGLDNNLMSLVDGVSPAQSTLVKGLVAGATNLAIGLVVEGVPAFDPRTLALALLVGATGYGISLVLYVAASQQLGATRSQAVFSTAPFWGVALSWLVLGEPVTPIAVVASVLLALALVVLPRDRHAHAHTHERIEHAHWHRHDDAHHEHAHEVVPRFGWHFHAHVHDPLTHEHAHEPDLHHRHDH
ncbi:DMT family transporter [Sandaracinus amylolyticus]|uniref:DMT family transporter n=1 Tax=Sandaracinus amylolyticus TaxID=927083 RepID=UPI001F3FAF33|nr:DMT family transporter [Sandaracinus amylolyticus]UJR78750.1 Multidrug DMT transporter permease [Sandaracinus amylolyticus]